MGKDSKYSRKKKLKRYTIYAKVKYGEYGWKWIAIGSVVSFKRPFIVILKDRDTLKIE
jgi:hypothetical protein